MKSNCQSTVITGAKEYAAENPIRNQKQKQLEMKHRTVYQYNET